MCDEQTLIEVKQDLQAEPETTHTMCEKFEDFWKNQIFNYFFIIFYAPSYVNHCIRDQFL